MPDKKIPGLYVHVPFCLTKCPYCDFYSHPGTRYISAWLDAVEREMVLYTDQFSCFDTLYLGGGSPTVLSLHEIERLTASIHRRFSFLPDTETTIEANPADITGRAARGLKQLGFNRISLGVQSFDDTVLTLLKRRHTAADAKRAIRTIRNAGFENLSIDLMYGVPGQDMAGWKRTLEQALSFTPEHVSCYQLTIKENTPFGELRDKGLLCIPAEKEEEALFLTTAGLLAKSGYEHYEVSSFATAKAFCSRHNRKYWNHAPYLGLGPAAHSFNHNRRWWNRCSIETYLQALARYVPPREAMEEITADQLMLESLFLNFRTRTGIPLARLGACNKAARVLPRLQQEGLVRVAHGRVVPTTRGLLVADSLPLLLT